MTDPRAPLVFLHGFTQNHHHLVDFATRLSARTGNRPTVLVDLPGHGLSAADHGSIVDAAAAVVDLAGRGDYIGYSMGGRTALHAALAAPATVQRLVLIGATAGIDVPVERAERRAADDRLADHIEQVGVEAFIGEWLAGPLWTSLPDDPADRVYRRRTTAAGLAHSLRTAGTGAQASLWDRLADVAQPTLVIAGARDPKFIAIGERLTAGLPNAELALIDDAGHAAHIEQPAATAAAVAAWLDQSADTGN